MINMNVNILGLRERIFVRAGEMHSGNYRMIYPGENKHERYNFGYRKGESS